MNVQQEYLNLIRQERKGAPIQVPYGMWQTRVLEILQTVFSPMYRNVWEQNWNNSVFAGMKRPYYFCDFENGVYEIYIPTVMDATNNMHYWRIIVKTYDEIDEESMKANQTALLSPYISPMGYIDSETIVHLAQQTTPEYKQKLAKAWKEGGRPLWFKTLLRGFKHRHKRGYFTPIVIHQSPDIAVKRLLSFLRNFWKKRIVAFLKKLKLQDWMFQGYLVKRGQQSLLILLLEKYSFVIRNIAKNMLESYDWLSFKLKDLYSEIGRQNVQKTKIRPLLTQIRQTVDVFRKNNSLRNVDVPDPPIIHKLMCIIS